MALLAEYRDAQRSADLARLRRLIVLRAMVANGMSQRQIAQELGISQPAVSQQLHSAVAVTEAHPERLVEAAGPILAQLAEERGFTRLAVFGSVARHQARADSDVDLLVEPPPDTSISDLLTLRRLFQQVLGRRVDLVTYGGLKPGLDDDIRREAVLLRWIARSPRNCSICGTGLTVPLRSWIEARTPTFEMTSCKKPGTR